MTKNQGAESPAVEAISDVTLMAQGIPPQLTKRAWKAIGTLISAAVEIPVSKMEGKALELRAESEARVKISQEISKQIVAGINVDTEFSQAAMIKHAQRITRHQLNRDMIGVEALENLKFNENKSIELDSDLEISEDWLNAFGEHAGKMGSNEMRRLFAKILANEIRKPTSFSIRTLNLMAQLDNKAALLFTRLCSLASVIYTQDGAIADARVMSKENPGTNSLMGFGLDYASLNILEEYGLITSEYYSHMDYRYTTKSPFWKPIPFTFEMKKRMLVSKTGFPLRHDAVLATGVALSTAGKELFSIVDTEIEGPSYEEHMQDFFGTLGYRMVDYVE